MYLTSMAALEAMVEDHSAEYCKQSPIDDLDKNLDNVLAEYRQHTIHICCRGIPPKYPVCRLKIKDKDKDAEDNTKSTSKVGKRQR